MSPITDRLTEADLRELARLQRVIHERSEARRNGRGGPVASHQDRLAQAPAAAKHRKPEIRLAAGGGSGGDGGAP
jgi:hypothetical protein